MVDYHQEKLDDLLMRVGLVLPMILIWKAASNDICLIDQRRGVFRFLHSMDLSMEKFLRVTRRSISMRMVAVTCCVLRLATVMV